MIEGQARDLDLLSGWLSQTAEIERLTARFRVLADAAPAGVAVITRERLLFANTSMRRVLGPVVDALPALPLSQIFPESAERGRVRAALRRAWNGSAEDVSVLSIARPDGARTSAALRLRPLAREVEPTLLIVVDERAEAGPADGAGPEPHDTLRVFGLYLAGLANDLRGPLTALLGHLTLLAKRTDLPDDLRDAFDLYRQVTDETLDRFGRAMEWGRRVPLVERVNFRDVVNAAAGTFESETPPADIRLTIELETVPPIAGNSAQLQLAIEHVLRNAGEALADRGGSIRVTLRNEGRRIRLVVADDGPGIPDSLLPHVFDPFSSTKSITAGLGLGLAIVKDIVGRHQGEVAIASTDRGTVVTFTFDAVDDPSVGGRRSGRYRVLLVEDNLAIQETYRMLLERAGWDVLSTTDADQALLLLTRETVDALIVDVQMSGRDGLALLEALATWHPNLLSHVALHTAYAYEERVRAAAQRYGVALLPKPCPFEKLLATLRELASGEVGRS